MQDKDKNDVANDDGAESADEEVEDNGTAAENHKKRDRRQPTRIHFVVIRIKISC